MEYKSLQEKFDKLGNPAEFLRNVGVGAYVYPIPSEFTNWRDEQRSWRETVGLLDQSLHIRTSTRRARTRSACHL